MPYVTRQPMGDCGCGCKGKPAPGKKPCGGGMGTDDPIQNITGTQPGPLSTGISAQSVLPFVAIGGLAWFLLFRKKRRR